MSKTDPQGILEALREVLAASPVAESVDRAMSLPAGDVFTVGMSRLLNDILDGCN